MEFFMYKHDHREKIKKLGTDNNKKRHIKSKHILGTKNYVIFLSALFFQRQNHMLITMNNENIKIVYKPMRNGYVRVNNQWEILISIPNRLKHNEAFKNALLEKGKKLLARHKKKTHILTSDKDHIQIFGEIVPTSDISPTIKKLPAELKKLLEEYSAPILQHYSQALGVKVKKLMIRKTKSKRWSCTSEQEICLNLSLIHLPTKYIKYVIIHEACHLKIHDHSKRFRALVEKYCPQYKEIKKEMKEFVIQ